MKRLFLSLALAALASSASAELAMLTTGRVMKIESYGVSADVVDLVLPGGGTVTLPLDRIERIVDDEVTEVTVEEAKVLLPSLFPHRSWSYAEDRKPLFNSKFDEIILEAARKHDVDPALVSAVIKAESDYNPRTVSHKGAQGLMQLMPATAARFGVTNAFDPRQNVFAGTKYLRWLLNKFENNPELAVAAYNAGEGNVMKYDGVPPFRETVEYVKRVARPLQRAAAATTAAASVPSAEIASR